MWRAVCAFICFIVHATHAQDDAQTLDSAISDDSSTRIIGGNATTVQKYPFAVQILYNSQLSCGGSLITRQHVLSAAHCFVASNGQQVSAAFFSVRVGATYTNIGGTVHQVSQVVVHHSYNNPLRDNDIAVLTLATPVTISSSVTTAYILEADARLADSAAVVTVGWGRTNVSVSQGSNVLNEVQVYMVNQSVCETRYALLEQLTGDPYPVTDNMICAGIIDIGGKDACQGDSGGPLLYKNIVVGITSWGWGCAQPRFPGVYTRVSAYTNWINSTASGVSHTRLGSNASKMKLNLFLMITSFFLVSYKHYYSRVRISLGQVKK